LPTQRPKAPTPSHFHWQLRVQFGLVLSFQEAASVGDMAATIVATTIATRAAIPRTVNRRNISPSLPLWINNHPLTNTPSAPSLVFIGWALNISHIGLREAQLRRG